VRNVVLGVVSAAMITVVSVGGIQALLDRTPDRTLGADVDRTVLPTDGPVPGETSLLLASGQHDRSAAFPSRVSGPFTGLVTASVLRMRSHDAPEPMEVSVRGRSQREHALIQAEGRDSATCYRWWIDAREPGRTRARRRAGLPVLLEDSHQALASTASS
jgi:hypothetical protein